MGELLEANVIERWRREPLSFIDQVLRDPKTGLAFKLFDAERQFLSHAWQTNDDGRLKYPDQIYSGIKKIGKSTLAAMHVITTVMISGRYAEGYVIANDLEQAQGRVFQAIRQIIESSPLLRREAELYASRIVFPQLSSTIQAISGGDAGAAGGQPCISSFDELWGFSSERARRLYDEFIPIPTQPISIRLVTTHAGYSGESQLLEELYAKGTALPLIGPDLHAGNSMLFFWSCSPLAPWQKVNGSHEAWLQEQRNLTRPLQYARQFENKFVSSDAQFIAAADWDACVKLDKPPHSNPMVPIIVAIDASTKRDSTAIVAVAGEKDNVVLRYHKIFEPTTNKPIDFEEVEQCLIDLKKKYPNAVLVYDQYQLASVVQRLSKLGWRCEEFIQSPQNLSACTQCLYDLTKYQRLILYPDSKMRDAALRAVITENTTGMRLAKQQSDDIITALAMAAYRCTQRHSQSVDLSWKYRAFDPNFRDEDLPPLPEPEHGPPGAGGDWWRGRPQVQTSSANERLRNYYLALETAFRWGPRR